MTVSICENCAHYRRKRWTTTYKPANFHTIGVTHAFGYCAKHDRRCREVKKCTERVKAVPNGE